MKNANPEIIAKIAACFKPPRNESSLIFPARIPPKKASKMAVCKNTLLANIGDNTGFMSAAPSCANSLMGINIRLEIRIIMKRNMITEK